MYTLEKGTEMYPTGVDHVQLSESIDRFMNNLDDARNMLKATSERLRMEAQGYESVMKDLFSRFTQKVEAPECRKRKLEDDANNRYICI